MIIQARKVLALPYDLGWEKIKGDNIKVQFDDGEKFMTAPEIMISKYCWCFHERDPSLPLLTEDTINSQYLRDSTTDVYSAAGVLSDDFFRTIMENVLNRVKVHGAEMSNGFFVPPAPKFINECAKLIMVANSRLYNALIEHCDIYMTGLNSLDIIAVNDDKDMRGLKAEMMAELSHIPEDQVSERIAVAGRYTSKALSLLKSDMILEDGTLSVLSWLARRNIIKSGPMLQSVFSRGYVPEINGKMIPHFIDANLCEGMATVTNYMVQTRESVKAMAASTKDIQDITVDGRSTSYVGMSVRNIVRTDCGTHKCLAAEVTTDNFDNLRGCYFKRTHTETAYEKFGNEHKDMIGDTLYFRYIHGCNLPNPEHRCSICCGSLADSYGENEYVGPIIAKALAEINAQLSLSFKHFISGAGSSDNITQVTNILTQDKNGFKIAEQFMAHKLTMVLEEKSVFNYTDIIKASGVEELTPGHVAKIVKVKVYAEMNGEIQSEDIVVAPPGKDVDPSIELLRYLRLKHRQGNEIVSMPEFGTAAQIDITDYGDAYLFKKISQIDTPRLFVEQFMAIILNRENNLRQKLSPSDYDGMLIELLGLMSQRSDINLFPLSVLLSSLFHNGPSYDIASGDDSQHGSVEATLWERSLSTWFIFREATKPFKKAGAYLNQDRGNSPLDVVICPNEVVAAKQKR